MKAISNKKDRPLCKRCGKKKESTCQYSHWCQRCNNLLRLVEVHVGLMKAYDEFLEYRGNDYY
jgi:tRNA(Ile2) C34 agmatinyltransferase TiaS